MNAEREFILKWQEFCRSILGWQGGTVWQLLSEMEFGPKWNIRRYGNETYYTRSIFLRGHCVGCVEEYNSQFPKNPHDAYHDGVVRGYIPEQESS